jgi:hypothetical protein
MLRHMQLASRRGHGRRYQMIRSSRIALFLGACVASQAFWLGLAHTGLASPPRDAGGDAGACAVRRRCLIALEGGVHATMDCTVSEWAQRVPNIDGSVRSLLVSSSDDGGSCRATLRLDMARLTVGTAKVESQQIEWVAISGVQGRISFDAAAYCPASGAFHAEVDAVLPPSNVPNAPPVFMHASF